jgi:hypothetical protein
VDGNSNAAQSVRFEKVDFTYCEKIETRTKRNKPLVKQINKSLVFSPGLKLAGLPEHERRRKLKNDA